MLLNCNGVQGADINALIASRAEIRECDIYSPFSRVIIDVIWRIQDEDGGRTDLKALLAYSWVLAFVVVNNNLGLHLPHILQDRVLISIHHLNGVLRTRSSTQTATEASLSIDIWRIHQAVKCESTKLTPRITDCASVAFLKIDLGGAFALVQKLEAIFHPDPSCRTLRSLAAAESSDVGNRSKPDCVYTTRFIHGLNEVLSLIHMKPLRPPFWNESWQLRDHLCKGSKRETAWILDSTAHLSTRTIDLQDWTGNFKYLLGIF